MSINARVADAFWAGTPISVANTNVIVDGDNVTMCLHGSAIVRRWHNRLEISAAGHPTLTTMGRINAVLRPKGHSIHQRTHMWFIKRAPETASLHALPRSPERMDTAIGIWTLVDPGSAMEQIAFECAQSTK